MQDELGLELYDFHARQYDAQIGRFWGIDPADQFPSGYTGMGNDPASGVDPTGMVTSGAGNMNTEIRATEIHSVIEGSLDFYQWSDELKTPGGSGGAEVVDVPSQTIVYYYQNGVSGGGEEQKEEKGLLDRIKDTYKRIDNAVTEAVYSNAVGSAVMYNFVIPFNESVNPVYGVVNGVYGTSTGKDFTWGTPVNKTASGVSVAFAFIPGMMAEKALANTAERTVANASSNLWKVGPYNKLRGVEKGLDAHHVGQRALYKKFIPGYNEKTAPSILVPVQGHRIPIAGSGFVSRKTVGFMNARQVLARDIFELRRVYPTIPNSALQELIKLNKLMYSIYLRK